MENHKQTLIIYTGLNMSKQVKNNIYDYHRFESRTVKILEGVSIATTLPGNSMLLESYQVAQVLVQKIQKII